LLTNKDYYYYVYWGRNDYVIWGWTDTGPDGGRIDLLPYKWGF